MNLSPDDPCLMNPEWLANVARSGFVPGVVWVKDGKPSELGRIGRRNISYIPLTWLPQEIGDAVKILLKREPNEPVT